MNTLFHVSEQSGIERFEPRTPPTVSPTVKSPVVWAVGKNHLANYLLPRECPRVAFRKASRSAERGCEKFLGSSGSTNVVAIESRWFERAASCILRLYEFSLEPFVCADANAGHFISSAAVVSNFVAARRAPAH